MCTAQTQTLSWPYYQHCLQKDSHFFVYGFTQILGGNSNVSISWVCCNGNTFQQMFNKNIYKRKQDGIIKCVSVVFSTVPYVA